MNLITKQNSRPNGGFFLWPWGAIQFLSLLVVAAVLTACGDSDQQQPESLDKATEQDHLPPESVENAKTAEEKRAFPVLKQANHEKFLRKFWEENPERVVRITTNLGEIDIRLFEETPIHSASFLMLSKRNYFKETLFTRVVPGFIIQAGSSDREELYLKRVLIGSYAPDPEFKPHLIHRRGALSAARPYEKNPEKRSSEYDFFIVVGRTFDEPQLMALERDHDKSFSEEHRKIYQTEGGAPHLDGEHTVFGEVVSGMDVVDKISQVPTDQREWPREDVEILKVEVLNEP
ncbi:MAG: peptidylprolyl isomerase [Cryomorphaceae bacterium]|nr:MAG: peptidylprolyl isomerase [Cryomorphaceae bacterium]